MCGGYSGGDTPGSVPIPVAKPASADGTALLRVWETKTLPHAMLLTHPTPFFFVFVCLFLTAGVCGRVVSLVVLMLGDDSFWVLILLLGLLTPRGVVLTPTHTRLQPPYPFQPRTRNKTQDESECRPAVRVSLGSLHVTRKSTARRRGTRQRRH